MSRSVNAVLVSNRRPVDDGGRRVDATGGAKYMHDSTSRTTELSHGACQPLLRNAAGYWKWLLTVHQKIVIPVSGRRTTTLADWIS